jgi:tight adherence protein B
MMGTIIVIVVGIGVGSIVAYLGAVLVPSSQSTVTEDRLSAMAARGRDKVSEVTGGGSLLVGDWDDDKHPLAMLLKKMPALSLYMEQADVQMAPSKFAFLCLACFGGGVASCILTPVPVILAPIVGVMFAALPFGWLMMKRKRRLSKFGKQLPEAMELLSRSLRAGHSLNAGFGLVSSEMEAPLAQEFGRAFEEQNFGIPLEEAIEEMANRVPNLDLRFFATAVILQRQTGGDLAEILDKIGHLIRERLMIFGQIQALTGEGRMSGAVLLALPPVLFLVMLKLNYDYIMVLFTDPIGRYLLCVALVTQIVGAIAIKKIITIKV